MLREDGNGLSVSRNLFRSISPLLLYFLLNMAVDFLGILVLMVLGIGKGKSTDQLVLDYGIYFLGITAAAAVPFFGKLYQNEKYRIPKDPLRTGETVLLALTGLSSAICGNLLLSVLFSGYADAGYETTEAMLSGGGFWMELLVSGFLVGAAEEMVFRGMILSRMEEWLTPAAAVFASALFFGIYHGNIIQFLYAFPMGILFAVAVRKFRSVKAAILMHCTANACILLLGKWSVFAQIVETDFGLASVIVLSGFILCGCIYRLNKIQ